MKTQATKWYAPYTFERDESMQGGTYSLAYLASVKTGINQKTAESMSETDLAILLGRKGYAIRWNYDADTMRRFYQVERAK